jgi:ribosomal protein S18 acetylase RimI-like enzyme
MTGPEDPHVEPADPSDPEVSRLFQDRHGAPRLDLALALQPREGRPGALLRVRRGARTLGVALLIAGRGAAGITPPPGLAEDLGPMRLAVAKLLLSAIVDEGRRQRMKLLHALLDPLEDASLEPAFLHAGYRQLTRLQTLGASGIDDDPSLNEVGGSELAEPIGPPPAGFTLACYSKERRPWFERAVIAGGADGRDLPELEGVRTPAETLDGHRSDDPVDPSLWRLLLADGEPAAVLLLTDNPALGSLELAYLGVLPGFRRRGLGRWLTRLALADGVRRRRAVTLQVDARNRPALRLYHELGFSRLLERRLFTRFLAADQPPGASEAPFPPTRDGVDGSAAGDSELPRGRSYRP